MCFFAKWDESQRFFRIFVASKDGNYVTTKEYRQEVSGYAANGGNQRRMDQIPAVFPESGDTAKYPTIEGGTVPGRLPARTVREDIGLYAQPIAWF